MSRKSLKMDAKAAMREASVNPYVVTVIYGIIIIAILVVQSALGLWGGLVENGTLSSVSQVAVFTAADFIFTIASFVLGIILKTGYQAFCLKVAKRDSSMSYGDLFSPVKYIFKVIGLVFMISLLVLLWTLLFIIPGIIASYRYSQAIFILAENPDKGIMQCIRESKEMMVGHKWEYFVLEISFILWQFLGIIICGLALIYVYPYMSVTLANYYNSIKPAEVVSEPTETWE